MSDTNRLLFDFIRRSPTPFHVVQALSERLQAAGYIPLPETVSWQLQPGGAYYVTRNGSSLIAFRIPSGDWSGFLITASHSDSPTFQVKENGELAGPEGYLRLNTEPYGGMLMAPWLDRPLSLAGRVAVRLADGTIASRLVDLDRDLLVIPSVAIHLRRDANKGAALDPKTDLVPLLGLDQPKGCLKKLAAQAAGVEEQDLLSTELFLYLRQTGTVLGAGGELIAAPRLDDLQCVYGCLEGFLRSREQGCLPLYAVFDNEEVGSATKQGADSTFLSDILRRICAASGRDLPAAAAASLMLSADNAHAVHPNHPEYADTDNRPRLNGGVVIKRTASQRYATDGLSAALFSEICRRAQVPVQHLTNRSDLPGGSTLGNIANTHVSLPTVDIGLPQLAMHSVYETAGAADTDYLIRAVAAFYSTPLRCSGDGTYRI